jgi:Na+-translocating ferredoxin:NAD+ oxidoreductase RnfC subunit
MAAQNVWNISSTAHEYLRDTLSFRYQECKSCRNRTELTCIKCGFCYSCHWKKEELEKKKIQSKPLITEMKYSYSSTSSSSTKTMMMTTQSRESVLMQQQQQQSEPAKVIDVFGQESEPICNYYRCHHKFSFHRLNSHTCHCKHPTNSTTGVSKSIHER